MSDGQKGAEDVVALTARVLALWRRNLRRIVDDDRPRSGDRGESERILVRALLRATDADDSSEDDALPALAVAAARYGTTQRRERIDPAALCDELASLRNVVWEILKERDPDTHEQALTRIFLFDRALSIVVRAAVAAGYDPAAVKQSVGCTPLSNDTGVRDTTLASAGEMPTVVPSDRREDDLSGGADHVKGSS